MRPVLTVLRATFLHETESVISLSEEAREAMQVEVEKKVQSIPDSMLSPDYASRELQVPTEIRLGDNPLFDTFKDSRGDSKSS